MLNNKDFHDNILYESYFKTVKKDNFNKQDIFKIIASYCPLSSGLRSYKIKIKTYLLN